MRKAGAAAFGRYSASAEIKNHCSTLSPAAIRCLCGCFERLLQIRSLPDTRISLYLLCLFESLSLLEFPKLCHQKISTKLERLRLK